MDWYRLWKATMAMALLLIGTALLVLATIVTNWWFLILALFWWGILWFYKILD